MYRSASRWWHNAAHTGGLSYLQCCHICIGDDVHLSTCYSKPSASVGLGFVWCQEPVPCSKVMDNNSLSQLANPAMMLMWRAQASECKQVQRRLRTWKKSSPERKGESLTMLVQSVLPSTTPPWLEVILLETSSVSLAFARRRQRALLGMWHPALHWTPFEYTWDTPFNASIAYSPPDVTPFWAMVAKSGEWTSTAVQQQNFCNWIFWDVW